MKQSVSEMQDDILRRMEKHGRNAPNTKKTPTLKEQLDALNAYEKLSPSEKLAKMEWRDWSDLVVKKLSEEFRVGRQQYIMRIVNFTYKKRFEEFHAAGKSMREISEIVLKEMPDHYDF
jgi:hypothetical protein